MSIRSARNLAEEISKIAESIPLEDRATDFAMREALIGIAELSAVTIRHASGDYFENSVRDRLVAMTELLPYVVKPDIKRVFQEFSLRK